MEQDSLVISVAPDPAPAGYGHEGLGQLIRMNFDCGSEWLVTYEAAGDWNGFMHEFRLLNHPSAEACFIVPAGGRGQHQELYSYLKDGRVGSPKDAIREMLKQSTSSGRVL